MGVQEPSENTPKLAYPYTQAHFSGSLITGQELFFRHQLWAKSRQKEDI